MKYVLHKIIISDDPGAEIYQELAEAWTPINEIDANYKGPLHHWTFYQLGDFDQLEVSIVKWELWSCWRLNAKEPEINKGAFIGADTLLGFYYSERESSFSNLKNNVELFLEKRNLAQAPIMVYALDVKSREKIPKEHLEYVISKGGNIMPVSLGVLKKRTDLVAKRLFQSFVKIFDAQKCEDLNIQNNWWHISLEELRKILEADQKGKKLVPRHKQKEEGLEVEKLKPKPIEAKKEFTARKLTLEDLDEEDRKHVAIGPNGEIIPKEEIEQKTEEELLELVKKGFELPDWVVIPRHCPKCFNQNQASIREVDDKDNILMERPKIYGKKFICGNCGKEWT